MKRSARNVFFIVPLILIQLINLSSAQKKIDCGQLKSGIFHSYPMHTKDHYYTRRDSVQQLEINATNGDSVVWKIHWTDDCDYTLQYESGGNSLNAQAMAFVKKHIFVYQIATVTNDYYTFYGYVDQPSAKPFYVDTMWLSEKAIITEHGLFSSTSEALLKRGHFADTSQYAVIYLYRPGKFTNSLGNYNIYFDNKFMCVAKNKSGYIFKIYKEGNFEVKSVLYKDESSINLPIQFGKRYFVKSMIHWGIYKRLYNFKLEMAQMKPEDAKPEFEMVNLQN